MNVLGPLWQFREAEAKVNPKGLFDGYDAAIQNITNAAATADDTKLLAQSWKIFDNESARRGTIDSRASALMPATGLAATLVTGVGFTVLKETAIPFSARIIMLVTFVLALVYLARTTVLLFVILGKVFRSTLDPTDLMPPAAVPAQNGETIVSTYDRTLASKVLRCVVYNYKVNNVQSDTLFAAQHAFRNAIMVIVIGGAAAGLVIASAATLAALTPS